VLPPSSYLHEQEKIQKRWPAAQGFIQEQGLNELFAENAEDFGIICKAGCTTPPCEARTARLSDAFARAVFRSTS